MVDRFWRVLPFWYNGISVGIIDPLHFHDPFKAGNCKDTRPANRASHHSSLTNHCAWSFFCRHTNLFGFHLCNCSRHIQPSYSWKCRTSSLLIGAVSGSAGGHYQRRPSSSRRKRSYFAIGGAVIRGWCLVSLILLTQKSFLAMQIRQFMASFMLPMYWPYSIGLALWTIQSVRHPVKLFMMIILVVRRILAWSDAEPISWVLIRYADQRSCMLIFPGYLLSIPSLFKLRANMVHAATNNKETIISHW